MDPPPDLGQILARIAQQDAAALTELHTHTADKLFAITMTILKDKHESQDSLQESFLKIWKNASRYQSGLGSPLSWLITITRNTAFDRYRKRSRQAEQLSRTQAELSQSYQTKADLGADQSLLQSERRSEIIKALKSLNPDQRQAIEMAFFSGQSQQEVSDSLGVPLGTIKARIRRGMQLLRPHLLTS